MIVNGKSVSGIFYYNPEVTYEEGDFVVKDDNIYICKVSCNNCSPDMYPEYFKSMPGDKIATPEEYLNYVQDTNAEDKYISLHTLQGILNHYFFGLGRTGIITDSIYTNGSNINYSVGGYNEIIKDKTYKTLDRLIKDPDLNNGCVLLSRDLEELKNIAGILRSGNNGNLILRQYTYLDSNTRYYTRVQELIDPMYQQIWFRYTTSTITGINPLWNGTISSWKASCLNNDLLTRVNQLANACFNTIASNTEVETKIYSYVPSNNDSIYSILIKNITEDKINTKTIIESGKKVIELDRPSTYEVPLKVVLYLDDSSDTTVNVFSTREASILIPTTSITNLPTFKLTDNITLSLVKEGANLRLKVTDGSGTNDSTQARIKMIYYDWK